MLFAAFPLKNWLEIKRTKKMKSHWEQWFAEKNSLEEYCAQNHQDIQSPMCLYCGSNRQGKIIRATLDDKVDYGYYNNRIIGSIQYLSYHCSRCGTELYRAKRSFR